MLAFPGFALNQILLQTTSMRLHQIANLALHYPFVNQTGFQMIFQQLLEASLRRHRAELVEIQRHLDLHLLIHLAQFWSRSLILPTIQRLLRIGPSLQGSDLKRLLLPRCWTQMRRFNQIKMILFRILVIMHPQKVGLLQ